MELNDFMTMIWNSYKFEDIEIKSKSNQNKLNQNEIFILWIKKRESTLYLKTLRVSIIIPENSVQKKLK